MYGGSSLLNSEIGSMAKCLQVKTIEVKSFLSTVHGHSSYMGKIMDLKEVITM